MSHQRRIGMFCCNNGNILLMDDKKLEIVFSSTLVAYLIISVEAVSRYFKNSVNTVNKVFSPDDRT